ncbi:MAG: dihydroorotate dehydrogenase [Gemmatimonadaceae bacterium]
MTATNDRATAVTATLAVSVAGLALQNPVVLASGTAGYGDELAAVVRLDALGALVTKAVSLEPRAGAPAPRVADFPGGMINAVGLANPGLEVVRHTHLPWLSTHLRHARVIVNVVGRAPEDFPRVVEQLSDSAGAHAFELNVSCPNVTAGGVEFGADRSVLEKVVRSARAATPKPLFVKLSPTLEDIVATAQTALDAGADGLTLVNTLPGLVVDVEHRRPALGFGTGGVSGPGLLPIGVLATAKVYRATRAPIIGVGGVASAIDALQYIIAGASAVAVGTAALRDPRTPERIVRELARWCSTHGVTTISALTGALAWPA